MTRSFIARRDPVAAFAFTLAALACVLGLFLCVVKSPQAKSAQYRLIAQQMAGTDITLAAGAALEAVRLDPYRLQNWETLADMLQQQGAPAASAQAREIAAKLHNNPQDKSPVYAMPAALRLSFLADQPQGL